MPQVEPSPFEKRATEALRSEGLRITGPRLAIIRTLAASHVALSVNDLFKGAGGPDLVSVYRTLAILQKAHLVHHISLVDGYLACQVEHESDAIEHAVCEKCGTVTEVPVTAETKGSAQSALESSGFRAKEIRIEISGVCARCSA